MGLCHFETVFACAVLVYLILKATGLLDSKAGPPRVPYSIPFVGHNLQLNTRASEFLQDCREKYGGVFVLQYLGERVIVFSGDDAKEMIKMPGLLVKEPRNRVMFISDAIGEWALSHDNLDAAIVTRKNIAHLLKGVMPQVLAQISTSLDSLLVEPRVVIDAYGLVSEIVVSSVAVLLVGPALAKNEQLREIMKTYSHAIECLLVQGIKWKTFPFVGSYLAQCLVRAQTPSLAIRKAIRSIIKPAFVDRSALANPPDATNVLDSLVDEGHSIDTIAHSLMGLIFASVSTTTNTSLMLISDLLAFPQHITRLRLEQEQVVGNQTLTKNHLDRMGHLNSAIRETLRHRGHRLEQWRTTSQSHVLPSGMEIPKGALLALDVTSLHFDAAKYPSPFEYEPFRFVGSGLSATRTSASFIGFGSGRHACPGRFFAVHEVTAIVSTLLGKCDISTEDGEPGPFTAHSVFPENFRIVLTKRTPSVLSSEA